MKKLIFKFILLLIDPLILWCSGFKKVIIKPGYVHYKDPVNGDYWLKDAAILIAERRLRKET